MPVSALTLVTMPKISRVNKGESPSEGSSSSSSFGADISARPIASICCSPPESRPACCAERSFRRGNQPWMRSRSRAAPALSARANAPSIRFSATERKGNTWRPSGASTTPARATSSASSRAIDRPWYSTEPLNGSTTPAMVLSRVDLPAPLAPSTVTMRPAATSIDTPRIAHTGPYQVSRLRTASSGALIVSRPDRRRSRRDRPAPAPACRWPAADPGSSPAPGRPPRRPATCRARPSPP